MKENQIFLILSLFYTNVTLVIFQFTLITLSLTHLGYLHLFKVRVVGLKGDFEMWRKLMKRQQSFTTYK